MSEELPEAKYGYKELKATATSKELTDKIHRLIRRFSRELVELVSQEIGARAIVVKGKPGPRRGRKATRRLCPLCGMNENAGRKYGFICKSCRAPLPKVPRKSTLNETILPGHERKYPDRLGEDFEVVVPTPAAVAPLLTPKEVHIEDAEPDFLDRLVQIVEPPPKLDKVSTTKSDSEEFFS